MQVQFLDAPDFVIDSNGILSRSGTWMLSADSSEGEISVLARQWAGNTGEAWREPDADGRSYTSDPDLTVTRIECKALDSRNCEVTFHARAKAEGSSAAIYGTGSTFERKKDLSEYKSARILLINTPLEATPAVGDLIDWAGENYRCESISCAEQSDGSIIMNLTAVNTAIAPEGRITSDCNHDNEQTKTGCWLVTAEALEDFLDENQLHTPALWAGENFYIYRIHTEPADSARRTKVTLQARKSTMTMIEKTRSEEIVSMAGGFPHTLHIWQSRWRAAAGDQHIFEAMLGTQAAWTGNPDMIICKVKPQRISDCEYEYLLEARLPEHIGSDHSRSWQDDDLPGRKEFFTRIGEIRLSPLQCGYNYRSNGAYVVINNWDPGQLCPLDTTTVLARRWVNQPIKVLEVVEVSYLSGTSADNIAVVCSWFNSSRVVSMTIAGVSGSFLRYDLEIRDMRDSRDRQWTKISKVYRQSPSGYDWNKQYWI